MSQERPTAVTAALWSLAALAALTLLTAVLAIVFHDELTKAWASGRPDAASVQTPAIAPVAVVMLVVVVVMVAVLMEFFRARHPWARTSLSAMLVLLTVATLATLRVGMPPLFVALAVASVALDVVALVTLWHRDTTAYLKASVDAAPQA